MSGWIERFNARQHLLDRLRLLCEMASEQEQIETDPGWKNYYANIRAGCAALLYSVPRDSIPCPECGREAAPKWLDQCLQVSQRSPVPGYCERCLQRLDAQMLQ